jgi:phospholipid/cholesterol/gamma-HCH transport system substrate-binding protein
MAHDPDASRPPAAPPDDGAAPIAQLERKARWLLLSVALMLVAAATYVLYARGAFERTQTLVLVADNSEGVVIGMDLTFAGFPIGRVNRIELGADGNARIVIDVPRKDARWLRESSVFTMESALVGATKLRAFSGILADPPLPDGAERKVLSGDASSEIPRLVTAARDLVVNLTALTASDAPMANSLRNVETTTTRLAGPNGALGAALGNEADVKKVLAALDRTNALLARLDALALKVDGLAAKTDTQVFGPDGVMPETRATVVQLNGLLAEARNSLKKVDAVLQEAQAVAANTREATSDLGALRTEVEASLRKVDGLVNEINRKWPFARDTEIKLP